MLNWNVSYVVPSFLVLLIVMGYYFAPLHYISGDIIVDGQTISNMRPDDVRRKILGNEIAYIPQAAMNALNPTQKIIRFIEDVIHAHGINMTKKEFARRISEVTGLDLEKSLAVLETINDKNLSG